MLVNFDIKNIYVTDFGFLGDNDTISLYNCIINLFEKYDNLKSIIEIVDLNSKIYNYIPDQYLTNQNYELFKNYIIS
ncbi:hypothetical protein Catovirus_1_296 [Catovirus CTV1]|uniref:Uncharacterized protein n=1 Tax=Catovirus CTV1 TaxID=1977631 RepID=A0A1V0S964_9VIRU|nr:hypothetical protein Catovirus_1_296 [Catovirus CTV1]